MERSDIPIEQFVARPYSLWERSWLLLTCGDFASGKFNCMTVSWGGLGQMWGRPFALVVVRPQRYTRLFIEKYSTFTLSAFPRRYRQALNLLGSLSGRDGDKIAQAGLTPLASKIVAAPGYAEAELILECSKIFWQDYEPAHFLDPEIDQHYPEGDYHRMYFGEILSVQGVEAYLAPLTKP